MESVLAGIDDVDVYIDDVGAFSQTWEHHIKLLGNILRHLHENGFSINPLKCEWAIKETDWLGYLLTNRGIKPWKKKIDAILHMDQPRNATELRVFIGCVNYYQDMVEKHAPIPWMPEMQIAFDKMRALMAAETLTAYPDHNKPFDVYTDASDYKLGACIVQEGHPVAYFPVNCQNYNRIIWL
ncbi:hypothetical protein ACHAW6_006033 [Cyclotella cf. meneghiniana]